MRIEMYLKSSCLADSIRFYVDELAMFTAINDFGTGFCTLRAKALPALDLILDGWQNLPGSQPRFGLSVDDCYAELDRLRRISFESGGGIVPDAHGRFDVFEYPGGRNLTVRDPDNNRILLYEYFGDPV